MFSYPKNPSQHSADIRQLRTKPEFEPAFNNTCTEQPKQVHSIQVNEASDKEVQISLDRAAPGEWKLQYMHLSAVVIKEHVT